MGNDKLIIGEYLNTNVLWNVRSCAFETSSNCSSIAVCHEFGFSHRIFYNQKIQIPAWLAAFLVYFIFYFLKNYNEMKQNCSKIQKFWAKDAVVKIQVYELKALLKAVIGEIY